MHYTQAASQLLLTSKTSFTMAAITEEIEGQRLSAEGPQNMAQAFFIGYVEDLKRVVDEGGVNREFGRRWYTPDMEFHNTNGVVYTGEQITAWGYDLFAPFSMVAHSVDHLLSINHPNGFVKIYAYGKRILKLKDNKAKSTPDFEIPFAARLTLGPATNGPGFQGNQWHQFYLYWDTGVLKSVLQDEATVFEKENRFIKEAASVV